MATDMGSAYNSPMVTCCFRGSARGTSQERCSRRHAVGPQMTGPTRNSRDCSSVTAAGVSHLSPVFAALSVYNPTSAPLPT